MAMSLRRWLARLIRFELGLFLLLAFLAKVGAAGSQIPPDPYPNIYPGGERPKHFAAAAVYTGNPAKVINKMQFTLPRLHDSYLRLAELSLDGLLAQKIFKRTYASSLRFLVCFSGNREASIHITY